LAALRRAQDLGESLAAEINRLQEPVLSHLTARLQHSGGWSATNFRVDIRGTISLVQAEAVRDEKRPSGPGSIRKILYGDAIDSLGNDVVAWLPAVLGGREPTVTEIQNVVVDLWIFATGYADGNVPYIRERATRLAAAARSRHEAFQTTQAASRLAELGMYSAAKLAEADAMFLEAQRIASGRKSRKSQSRSQNP
jgi:hypothetical protein